MKNNYKTIFFVLIILFIFSLIFGNYLINNWIKIDIFPSNDFTDIRNVVVFIGIICLALLLASPWVNIKKLEIGDYLKIEKELDKIPTPQNKENDSIKFIGNIRDNFLYIGNLKKNEKKYFEAFSFYFCANNTWSSMLTSYRTLESLCNHINQNKEDQKLFKENIANIIAWFNESLKNANGEYILWKGRENLRDKVLDIQKNSIDKKDEEKAKFIIDKIAE